MTCSALFLVGRLDPDCDLLVAPQRGSPPARSVSLLLVELQTDHCPGLECEVFLRSHHSILQCCRQGLDRAEYSDRTFLSYHVNTQVTRYSLAEHNLTFDMTILNNIDLNLTCNPSTSTQPLMDCLTLKTLTDSCFFPMIQ